MKLLTLLLIAAPLSAQIPETITLEPAQVTINNYLDSIALVVTVEHAARDSASIARDEAAQRAMDQIAEYLANCGCVNNGPTTVNVITNAALTLAVFFVGWQISKLSGKDGIDGEDGQDGENGQDGQDGDGHTHGQSDDDHGEGSSE